MRKLLLALFVLFPGWLFAATGITVTDIADQRIYQRDIGGTTTDIVISGTYTGDAPTSVQGKVVLASDSSEVLAYADLTSATIAGGNWSGTLNNVPQGGMYHVYARDGGVQTTVDEDNTNSWGVGILVGCIGQSNGVLWWNTTYGGGTGLTPNTLLSYYNYADNTGCKNGSGGWSHQSTNANGAIAFANKIISATSIPVGLLLYNVNGCPLSYNGWYGCVNDYWLNTADGSIYDTFADGVAATGGKCEFVVLMGGEMDACASETAAAFGTSLSTLFGRLKTTCGNNDLKFIVSLLGRTTFYGTDTTWQQVNDAILSFTGSTEGAYLGSVNKDHTPVLNTWVHFDSDGSTKHGQRTAQTVLYILGEETYYRGPYMSWLERVDSTHLDIHIKHRGGTDITPESSITGISVLNDGTPVTVSSAARVDATTIRLTTEEATWGTTITVRNLYGQNPTRTGAVYDNSAMALPLEEGSITAESDPDPPVARSLTNGTIRGIVR